MSLIVIDDVGPVVTRPRDVTSLGVKRDPDLVFTLALNVKGNFAPGLEFLRQRINATLINLRAIIVKASTI
jgi:hypothetical protein